MVRTSKLYTILTVTRKIKWVHGKQNKIEIYNRNASHESCEERIVILSTLKKLNHKRNVTHILNGKRFINRVLMKKLFFPDDRTLFPEICLMSHDEGVSWIQRWTQHLLWPPLVLITVRHLPYIECTKRPMRAVEILTHILLKLAASCATVNSPGWMSFSLLWIMSPMCSMRFMSRLRTGHGSAWMLCC